jgi:hypothetical protein
MPEDTLAGLVDSRLSSQGWSITAAQAITGLSYRELHRIIKGKARYIRPTTIDKLEKLGIPRRDLALAAYGANGDTPAKGDS